MPPKSACISALLMLFVISLFFHIAVMMNSTLDLLKFKDDVILEADFNGD